MATSTNLTRYREQEAKKLLDSKFVSSPICLNINIHRTTDNDNGVSEAVKTSLEIR